MKTNKEKIEEKFEADYEALSKEEGSTFPTKCTLCGEIIREGWRKDTSGSLEGGKAKQLRYYAARQRHLAHIHPVEFAQISSTFRQRQPYNNNKPTPCNSTAAKHGELEMQSRVGPCLHCGKRYSIDTLETHRIMESFDITAGCREFGSLYSGNCNRWCPELVAAQQRKSTTVAHQTEVRQRFQDFVARGRDTMPLTVEEVNRQERIYGIYAQFDSMALGGLQYFGRTKRFQKRISTHEGDRVRYCTRGMIIPQRTALHVASELTFCEHKCAEYYLIQLIDILTDHPSRPSNEQLPYPWTPQSTSTQGARIQEENKAIHSEGRRLMAELLVDAILLHQRGRRADVIELERDPEAAVAQGGEGVLAETPSSSRRKHPRRKRPSAPESLQLAPCSSASSSTAPTTPATPTTSTPTLAPELLEMQRKLEESEQRIRELEEDNKNEQEQRKRYKRKTHAFSTKMNKLAERFNASVSPMTSPGSLPSQPPSQPAPLPPPCFD